jgi:hypothetical protein
LTFNGRDDNFNGIRAGIRLYARRLWPQKRMLHIDRKEDLELYFKEFNDAIVKYRINPADIYNMDETGF